MWLGHAVPGSFRRGQRPAAPVGPAAGGAVQRCAEQLLPGSAPWPAAPHRGLSSRRCQAERTIGLVGDGPCVVTDGVVFVSQTHFRPRPELDIDLTPVYLSPGLGGRSRARWLTAPGRRRLCRWELVSPILFRLNIRLFIGAAKNKTHLPSSIFCYGVLRLQCANPLVQ